MVACNVGRSHPIKSLDETGTNDQQLSINFKKKILSLKSLLNQMKLGSGGCDLLHWRKPEQSNDTFSFTSGK